VDQFPLQLNRKKVLVGVAWIFIKRLWYTFPKENNREDQTNDGRSKKNYLFPFTNARDRNFISVLKIIKMCYPIEICVILCYTKRLIYNRDGQLAAFLLLSGPRYR